nr:hypothetical protein [Deltaproteobacteria bacterium]
MVGLSLGALATGALLARRGFRVVALGHGSLPHRYDRDGRALYRRLGAITAHESPAFRRVFAELALLPAVRRRLTALDPAWQVVMPRRRIDVPTAVDRRVAEVLREFPEVPRAVEEFYAALSVAEPALDALFGADLSWPPEGFWERRRARALADALPLRPGSDLLGAFAGDHPFRAFVDAQCRFAGSSTPTGSPPSVERAPTARPARRCSTATSTTSSPACCSRRSSSTAARCAPATPWSASWCAAVAPSASSSPGSTRASARRGWSPASTRAPPTG